MAVSNLCVGLQVSMLGKGFGDVGEAKGGSTTGSQFLEQFKTAQALAQLAAQHSQPGAPTSSSWDMGSATQSPSLVQYGEERGKWDGFSGVGAVLLAGVGGSDCPHVRRREQFPTLISPRHKG